MGILSRLRPKEERLYKDPETGKTEWIPIEKQQKPRREIKELTREEQFPQPRKQPWQTERGKRVIGSVKSGAKRVDKAVVNYNRNYNPQRSRHSSYSPRNNYNPIGGMFDMGMSRPSRPHKSTSKTKYAVVGGKTYPVAGKKTSKKKKTKRKTTGFDPISNNWGNFKF